jgi:hypothetical protein
MSKIGQASRKLQIYGVLLLLVGSACGCGDEHLKRKYGYSVPRVPPDIPRYVSANPRVRGLEPREPGQSRIDLHREYLMGHEGGFCDAAQEWEANGQFKYKSFQDLDEYDAIMPFKRGYWDGYSLFMKNRVVRQAQGSNPQAEQEIQRKNDP